MHPQPQFALLNYRTRNIGDDIQSIAARRFLPRVDRAVDRDWLSAFAPEHPTRVICNGWFGTMPQNFGFQPLVDPLLISMHISEHSNHDRGGDAVAFGAVLRAVPELRAELKRFEPVGARDLATLRLLQELGIAAYFSGCLTLTLERDQSIERSESIVACDVPDEVVVRLREICRRPIIPVGHAIRPDLDEGQRAAKAEGLLRVYQSAGTVVTTRLHCALPCVAYGTPVIFLHHDFEADRFEGLSCLTRIVALREAANLRAEDVAVSLDRQQAHHDLRRRLIAQTTAYVSEPTPPRQSGDLYGVARALATFYERHASRFRDEVIATRSELAAMQQSRSWRLTSPLRAARRWLQGH